MRNTIFSITLAIVLYGCGGGGGGGPEGPAGDGQGLVSCRLYNKHDDSTSKILDDTTLDYCRSEAAKLPSNMTYWSSFTWTKN